MKELRQLEEGKRAVQQMMQMFQQQCEQRLTQYNQAAQKAWQKIEKETGIDLINVLWVPHPTDNKVMPVQLNLKNEGLTK